MGEQYFEVKDDYMLHLVADILKEEISKTVGVNIEKIYDFECMYSSIGQTYSHMSGDPMINYSVYSHTERGFIYSFTTGMALLLEDFKHLIRNDKKLHLELTLNKGFNYETFNMRCMITVKKNLVDIQIAPDILQQDNEEYQEILNKITMFLNNNIHDKISNVIKSTEGRIYNTLLEQHRRHTDQYIRTREMAWQSKIR